MVPTGWVAADVARRFQRMMGRYRWDEWERFASDYGLEVIVKDLPQRFPAFHIGRYVCLQGGMSDFETARCAWHEIGHFLLHRGGFVFWDSLQWGYLVVGKRERQADEFAATFPVWTDGE